MREPRLDTLVDLLRSHGRLSASELAARCGVTVRTIQRDIDELSRRGVPVYAEHGRTGGYELLPGYRPPASDLTDAETLALFLPGGAHPAGALGLDDDRRAAMFKLSALLDDDRHRRATLLQERLLVVPEGWREPVEPPSALRSLFAAVTSNRVVEIDYRPQSGAAGMRRCHPIGVVLGGTRWYLLARKADSGEIRTYRIDRIEHVAPTGDRFSRDPSDDLARLWESARSAVEDRKVEVQIRTRPEHLPVVRAVVDLVCRRVEEEAGDDGEVILTARAGSVEAAAGLLSGVSGRAEVIGPPEVRRRIAEIACAAARTYGPPQ